MRWSGFLIIVRGGECYGGGGEGCPRWGEGAKRGGTQKLVAAHEEEDPMSEAAARVKINRLLEEAGWRFFAEDGKPPTFAWSRASPSRRRTWTAWVMTSRKPPKASSTSCCSMKGDSRSSSWKRSLKRRTRSPEKSRHADTPAMRIAASSSSRTGTCTTSGTWSTATPTPSPRFRRRIPHPHTGKFRPPTPSV